MVQQYMQRLITVTYLLGFMDADNSQAVEVDFVLVIVPFHFLWSTLKHGNLLFRDF